MFDLVTFGRIAPFLEGQMGQRNEADLHPEAVSGEAAVSLATAVGASKRLYYLYQHRQSQTVGAEAGTLFLLTEIQFLHQNNE